MDNEAEQTAPRRLHRRSSKRVVAGVAGGLGDYTGIDVVFFRIGFIVLALAGGSGVLLYLLGWLVIPEQDHAEPIGLTMLERVKGRRWIAVALLGISALFLADWIQLGDLDWNLIWAIALIAVGFVLLKDETTSDAPATGPSGVAVPGVPVADAPVRRVKGPRSPLGFMTLGAAFVAVAVAAVLAGSSVVELDVGQFLALALMVLGVGLVVGTWWGRARLLVVVALLLVPIMLVASMIDVPLKGSITSDYHNLRREVQDEYRVLAGTLTLDFSRYRFGDEPVAVDLSFVAGDVNVYVPPGVDVEVRGEVDLGVADIFGDSYEGRDLAFDDGYHRDGLTKGTLWINVDGGIGSFDTTWARWVDQEKRYQLREEKRIERKKEQRREVRKDRRARASR